MKPDWSELMKLYLKAERLFENECKLPQNIMNHLPFSLKSFLIWEAGEAMKQKKFNRF